MKQDVAEYLIDSFIDFKGEEHKIVACALSQPIEKSEDGYKLAVGWVNEKDEFICNYRPFLNVFFLSITYKQSEILEVICSLCLLRSICQLEITYKSQEIHPLICKPPRSYDAFEPEFTYKQSENKVLICK